MSKPILCVDFDGVIHSYTSGWQGHNVIPDPPVPGALDFLREATGEFTVSVYSSRSGKYLGIRYMQEWLREHAETAHGVDGLDWFYEIQWPKSKPPAMVTIDDRALTFTGRWPTMRKLREFRPWNKKEVK